MCIMRLAGTELLQAILHSVWNWELTLGRVAKNLMSFHQLHPVVKSLPVTVVAALSFLLYSAKMKKKLTLDSKLYTVISSFNQFSFYLSQNHLLDPNQSDFMSGHSTETALLTLTESHCGATFHSSALNLSSAFFNHQILLSTLAELGIPDSALTYFTLYLTTCTLQATWNGSMSVPCFLKTGIPQDSVLGLLLFSLQTECGPLNDLTV